MAVNTAGKVKVSFDHFVEGDELLTIIKEGFKHLLFLRRQLPLPFLLLERENSRANNESTRPSHHGQNGEIPGKQGQNGIRPARMLSLKARKRDAAITAITDITDSFNDFINSRGIYAVALVFGSTVVSPKEIFLLRPKFRNVDEEGCKEDVDILHAKRIDKAARSLIRNLVTNPQLSSLSDMRPTNVFTFVLAARDPNSIVQDNFIPKQGYSLPSKGKHYDILLTNHDIIHGDDVLNELLDIQKYKDLIWYQAKHVLRGFSESKTGIF